MSSTPFEQIVDELRELYLSDAIPWIVGYSGGKDSTASLQLLWTAIASLPKDQRSKPIHVISTDTLVENPIIAGWVEVSLHQINLAALQQELPITAHRLTPSLENRFWVNLIGKGYPAPRPKFRWCTDRLKISASTQFIQELSENHGEAILVLGQRRGDPDAAQELYKLTRSLLAVQFQTMESHKRSKHLNSLEGVLRHYAFRNESEAFEFAMSSASTIEQDGDGSDGTSVIA